MQRLPDPDPTRFTPEQQRVWSLFQNRPGGVRRGPLAAWLRSPVLAERAQALGSFCRFDSSLIPRHSELAILVTAAWWRSAYEWKAHAAAGAAAGLDASALDAVREGRDPGFADPADAAVHAFAFELVRTRRVGDAAWNAAMAALGERGVIDLIGVLGYYALISMTICAVGIEAEGEPVTFG